jgi:hypothetical protein
MTTSPQNPLDYAQGFPARRGNPAAIVSLILGIVGCIPIITGLLAVIFGIFALRKTRDPAVNGKGMAIAGLVLGLISLICWCFFGGLIANVYQESKPAAAIAKQFLFDASAGNTDQAMSNSMTNLAQIQAFSQQLQQFGTLQAVNLTGFRLDFSGVMHVSGVAVFTSGQKVCTFNLVKQNGTYIVSWYSVR